MEMESGMIQVLAIFEANQDGDLKRRPKTAPFPVVHRRGTVPRLDHVAGQISVHVWIRMEPRGAIPEQHRLPPLIGCGAQHPRARVYPGAVRLQAVHLVAAGDLAMTEETGGHATKRPSSNVHFELALLPNEDPCKPSIAQPGCIVQSRLGEVAVPAQ